MAVNPYKSPGRKSDNGTSSSLRTNQSENLLAVFAAAFSLIAGTIGALLGSVWIHTFGFTGYRAHLAYLGLPLGIFTLLFSIVFLVFGVAIVRKRLWDSSGS